MNLYQPKLDAIKQQYMQLAAGYSSLQRALAELHERIVIRDAHLPAEFGRVPVRGRTDPLAPEYIEVEWSTGVPARLEIAAVITELAYRPNQDRRASVLGPGIFAASPETRRAVEAVNAAKVLIRGTLKEMWDFHPQHLQDVHDTLSHGEDDVGLAGGAPDICTQHLRRFVPTLYAAPRSVSFHWNGQSANTTRKSRDHWLAWLRRIIERLEGNPAERAAYQSYYDAILEAVPNGSHELMRRRPGGPRVCVKVVDANRSQRLKPISLPIAVRSESGFPLITRLESFRSGRRNRTRSDSETEPLPIVPELQLYKVVVSD